MTADDESFWVIGVATRTSNAAESDASTARLPGLWQRAFGHPALTARREGEGAEVVAVLTDYESDHTGAYTQIVGVRTDSVADLPEGLVAVRVPAEPRHRTPAHGPIPDALIAAWQQIWRQTEDGSLMRSYRTDYEVYTERGADIHLSVRSSD